MSNKTELQSNNTDLQAILETVNALPEVDEGGSSASVETCTVSIVSDIECDVNYVTVTEDDKLMLSSHFQQVDMGEQCKDYVVAKGTILTASDAIGHIIGGNIVSVVNTTGDVYLLIDSTEAWAFEVYGNGTIEININNK